MARTFNGTTQYATRASAYLASSPGPFTVFVHFTPANLTDTVKAVLANGTGIGSYWQLRLDAGVVVFESGGFSGTNPGTGSGISWTTAALKTAAWRYKGQGAEWSKWNAGVKSVINAAISFTLPNVGAQFDIARNWSGANCAGTYAEVAIWNQAVPDELMAELAAGVAPDQILRPALVAYFPLRGTNSPEPNYATAAQTLTLVNSPAQAAHPAIVPPTWADVNQSAWVVDFFHPNGTKRVATFDLTEDVDFDVLGAVYRGRLLNDITITESDSTEQAGGVMLPGQTTIEVENVDGWLDRSWEWRQCPVRIREYDRVSHALVTEFVGVVIDPTNMANDRMVFTAAGNDEQLLGTLIPRVVIEVGVAGSGLLDDTDLLNLRRMDVGKPVPLIFGTAVIALPFLKEDVDTSPGGGDFIVGWTTALQVRKVWFDIEATPGLEPALVFEAGPGTPTTATTTTFTVTGDQSKIYTPLTPVRRSGDSGATWSYSTVASYSGGTVTVSDAILPAAGPIGIVQIGGDFSVEKTRYKYVGAATTFLTTVRFPRTPGAIVLAEVAYPTLTNPADVIKFILENVDQGLGQTCNAASFAQAQTDYVNLGLGTAINGSIGGDGSQRAALDVLNELCAIYGATIWRDPETLEWMILVDRAPTVQTRSLEFGPDLKNDVAEVLAVNRTPLSQVVNTLTLRYQANGRQRGNKNFLQQDYAYRSTMTVVAGISGVRRTIESQFIRPDELGSHAVPARTLYYRGKRLQRSDQQVRFRMTRGGRRVRRGMVFPVTVPSAGLSTPTAFRVVARERALHDFVFTGVGPYDADIYDTNIINILAAVSIPNAEAAPEDAPAAASTNNLLLNSDFSTGLHKAGVPTVSDTEILPNWIVSIPALGTLTALSVTRDSRAVGGHYLTIGVGTAGSGIALIAWADPADATSGYAVVGGALHLFSVYLDSTAAGGPTANWGMELNWRDSAGVFISTDVIAAIRPVPGDVNGFGHQRYYGVTRAPANAAWAAPYFRLTGSSTTYELSAVQFEQQGNIFGRPSMWTRNAPHGIEPVNMRQGDQSVRVAGDPEAGATLQQKKGSNYDTGGQTLSGASTVVGTAGPGLLKNLTGRVTTAITGPASWALALDFGGGALTTVLDALPVALNSTFGDDKAVSLPIFLPATVNIVAVPSTGTFSAGKVKVLANVEVGVPPTS